MNLLYKATTLVSCCHCFFSFALYRLGRDFYFCDYPFIIILLPVLWNLRFSLYTYLHGLASSTMGELSIIWQRGPDIPNNLSRSNLSRSWSSLGPGQFPVDVSIPTTSSRQERLECLNKCLNYTVHEK